MTRESRWAHAETWIQMIVGTAIVQTVLWLFGIPLHTALSLNVIMFGLSYLRTYLIRRAFAWLRAQQTNKTRNAYQHGMAERIKWLENKWANEQGFDPDVEERRKRQERDDDPYRLIEEVSHCVICQKTISKDQIVIGLTARCGEIAVCSPECLKRHEENHPRSVAEMDAIIVEERRKRLRESIRK